MGIAGANSGMAGRCLDTLGDMGCGVCRGGVNGTAAGLRYAYDGE